MPITEKDYITMRSGNRSWLLLRGARHFHMIAVDAAWNEKCRRKLMKVYPCDQRTLEGMGLTVKALR